MGHSAGTFSITVSGLRFEVTDLPSDPILDSFYEGYDAAFVLPAEKEPIDGFRRCLTLNHPPTYDHLQATYGAFREVVFVAVDAATGGALGGGNFIVISHKPASGSAVSYRTIHLNYVFVLPDHRRRGHFKRLVTAIDPLATRALPSSDGTDTFVFIEQNDPLKMSPDAYAEDTRRTGLDQVERIALWARQGARVVDFDYVQPPLSADHSADDTLALCVLRPDLTSIDACVLHNHLRAFFGISVVKGANPNQTPAARSQLALLFDECSVGKRLRLLDPQPWIDGPGRHLSGNPKRVPEPGGLKVALANGNT